MEKKSVPPGRLISCFQETTVHRFYKDINKVFLRAILIAFVSLFGSSQLFSQSIPNEAIWSGEGYSLKKVASNTTIASGVNFSYTILFTAPAGATNVTIQDNVPLSLVVVSVPTPAIVNGITPVVTIVGNQVNYTLTGLPAAQASSGSFTIVVKFPEGTTCNGETARNNAGIQVDGKWNYTPFVSTTATAVDPWKVQKSIISGAVVNPNGGNCGYLMGPGDTITYRLTVLKNNGYWGNVVGQQNMAGAVVADILPPGAVFVSSSCATYSAGVVTWNVGALNAANAWAYYACDIQIYYPAGQFPIGSFIYNQLNLAGTMCTQQVSHTSNQTCIEVASVQPNPSGYFQKFLSLTNRVPGCKGYYTIVFCNNGNTNLSAFNINDVIPSGITVDKIQVYGAGANTPITVTANSGGNTLVTNHTGIFYDSGNLNYPVNNFQMQMNGTLNVGACMYIYVYFTIGANPANTLINNCATFNGLQNNLTLPQSCVSFTVAPAVPDPCLVKDICSPQTSYQPGDTVRFRLRVQNIGSNDIQGATIQDLLHSNFAYLGNESYYVANTFNPACSSNNNLPSGTTAWTGVTSAHAGNNLSWNLPDIESDCQLFYVAYCGYYGTWGIPYYFIEFDAVISNTAMPGVTPNNYTILGGNLTAPETSNTVNVLVVASFGQEVKKEISTDNGSSYASSATTTAGSTVRYRLNYKNTSNVPVSTINLVDLLPRNNTPADLLILNRSISRGSQFSVNYSGSHATSILPVVSPPATTLSYAPGSNICLAPFGVSMGCNTTTWGLVPNPNMRMDYGTFSLLPASTLREDFNVAVPVGTTVGNVACNDFAALSTANFLINSIPQSVTLTPIAAPPVCLTVQAPTPTCCDSVLFEAVAGANCCFILKTNCAVKSMQIVLNNGTIVSASNPCGTILPGYLNNDTLTFAGTGGNGCNLNMQICLDPGQGGVVIADVHIDFENGERCDKIFDLICSGTTGSCCDSIKLEPLTSAGCCAKLTTECAVDSIVVSTPNGTISSASANCGIVPTIGAGQTSFTYIGNGCAASLVVCGQATQGNYLSISYTVYFSNGEHCEKTIRVDCGNSSGDCCEGIDVRQEQNADGKLLCCAKITSKCEVDKIEVSIQNGTIASASWPCATLPSGYLGASTFTFPGNGCQADLSLCVDAIQTGLVTITYVVTFSNGETCEKVFKMDCEATHVDCCEGIDIRQMQDATGAMLCCAKITSTCEVDNIQVSIQNGTISSANWPCATLPSGYAGASSFTFPGNGCLANLELCVDAIQSGVVVINYVITFSNGEKCEKEFKMECKAEPVKCCETLKVTKLQGDDCCAKITSECNVKSIEVSITNGTIGSASWPCTTLPTGYVGANTFTFPGNGCAADLTLCINPTTTGVVTIAYIVTFDNGEKCEKVFKMECKATASNCCENTKVSKVEGDKCCAKITSECKVKAIDVYVSNGTIASASWPCTTLPTGYVGASSFTFPGNGCQADLTLCVDAIQTGVVTINYVVTFDNGETCKKTIDLECKADDDTDCCALVDFALKNVFPSKNKFSGTFTITNADPSTPICYVEISASPAGSFTLGTLTVDNAVSSQSWTPTRIPATGNLSPTAVNNIKFNLIATNYKGLITVCVVKCDGTRCCFEFKWNKLPWDITDVSIGHTSLTQSLFAASITPVVKGNTTAKVKYVSFGIDEEAIAKNKNVEFFAASAPLHEGDSPASNTASIASSYLGKYNVFYELTESIPANSNLGSFNLVFAYALPEINIGGYDDDCNLVFTGRVTIGNSSTVTKAVEMSMYQGSGINMFEFINLYPNPNNGKFTITYAIGKEKEVKLQVVNLSGQIISEYPLQKQPAGIHQTEVDATLLPAGSYRMIIRTNEGNVSKPFIVK